MRSINASYSARVRVTVSVSSLIGISSGTDLTLGTYTPFRHARESGHSGRWILNARPWTPASAGATEEGRNEYDPFASNHWCGESEIRHVFRRCIASGAKQSRLDCRVAL